MFSVLSNIKMLQFLLNLYVFHCYILEKTPSVLQTQNKTDAHLPNLACIVSLSGALLHSPSFPPVSISFYTFNMPKNSKTVRRNPKKYA